MANYIPWFHVDSTYLQDHPTHIFVYGCSWTQRDGSPAKLRLDRNTHSFVTKRESSNDPSAYFALEDYQHYFDQEVAKLIAKIESQPFNTFLVSKIGAGLANKYNIFERIIEPQLPKLLAKYNNVMFLGDWKH